MNNRLSMDITPLQKETHTLSIMYGSRAPSIRSRPASIVSKASKASKRTTRVSVRGLGTVPPSVMNEIEERPQHHFKSARLMGD
jgi:hypothetical protein